MSDFGPQLAADVLAACQAGADEAAGAFSRTFDRAIALSVGEAATLSFGAKLGGCDGPGLVLVLGVGSAAAVVLVPEATGLLPAWTAELDATGRSKLATLAQELGAILLPEGALADDYLCGRVDDLAAALKRGGAADEAGLVSLMLTSEGAPGGTAVIVWPLPDKGVILGEPPAAPAVSAPPAAPPNPTIAAPQAGRSAPRAKHVSLDQLPGYSKSLLRIEVPVQVILAATKQQVSRILELGPGSIIHFGKPCDEMLDLCVCGQRVAQGEAVKVGDKFGIRITSLTLPDERFKSARQA